MTLVEVHEATTQLSRLIERVEGGDDIVFARNGKPVARLVPVATTSTNSLAAVHGALRGCIRFAKDFDELPEDLAEALGAR